MANIFLDIEKGIEVGAKDLLKFLSGASSAVNKAAQAEPQVVAALGTILGAVATSVTDAATAAESNGLNIALDVQTVTDLKAVWPDIVAFAGALGIKL